MVKFMVVTKTMKDVHRDKRNAYLPDDWPAECREYETMEDAVKAHPGAVVFSTSEWKHFKAGLAHGHTLFLIEHEKRKNRWKFWKSK